MTLRNTEYRISFSSKKTGRFYYYFARDKGGWYQITAAGNRHKATAEQVLNHVLPALAGVKPNAGITVEYMPEDPGAAAAAHK
ncbi:MAG: hypothetical protein ACM32E_18445 [Gemmatimonadota bacterium]